MSNKLKRIQVNFTSEQYELLQELKGVLGNSDSEVVKFITICWLSEKSIIPNHLNDKLSGDIHEKID